MSVAACPVLAAKNVRGHLHSHASATSLLARVQRRWMAGEMAIGRVPPLALGMRETVKARVDSGH